jgi:hypothetical protein
MKKIILSLFLLTAVNLSASAETLAQWNFNSDPPDASTSTGTNAPSTGPGTASLIGGATATFNPGSTADAASTDNTGWTTSDYPGQGSTNKARGVQFSVSTLGFESIVITWEQRNTATSSKYTRVQYSIDGATFIDGPVITAFNDTQFHAQTASLATIAGVNDNPNFVFRIVAEFENTAIGSGTAGYAAAGGGTYSGGGGTIRYDLVTISGVPATGNNFPTISPITNRTIRENEALADVPFTVGDTETPADELLVSGLSSNQGLVANADITFGGSGINRTVTVAPTFFQSGTTTITLTVTDGGGKANMTSFVLTVLPVNTTPTLAASFTNYHTLVNVALLPIPFTIGDLETPANALEVTASSSNPTIIPESNVIFGGTGTNRTVTITPAANQTGNSVITITVSDLLLSASRSFNVMVVPSAGVVLFEPFDYPDGSLTTNSGGLWNTHSGTIAGQTKVAGGVLRLLSAQTEDVNARLIGSPYPTNHGTILYASFNASFSSLPNDRADYFAHFRETGGAFHARVFVSTTNSPAGTFRLGIGNTATTVTNAVTVERDLSTGASYLVVIRYNVDSGTSTLWVDPDSESAAGVSATDSPDPAAIATFAFRQSTGIGSLTIDNLKIGLAFSDVVPGTFESRLSIVQTASGVEVSWPAAATDDGYAIQTSTTLGLSADWRSPGGAPVRNGDRDVLAIASPAGNAFFRLRK